MSEFLDNYLEKLPDIPKPKVEIRTDGEEVDNVHVEFRRLNQAIVNFVMRKYPSMFVEDLDEFVLNFCNEYPYYRGSVVKERAEHLKMRGWK